MQVNKKIALALILTVLFSATIATYSTIQYIHFIENQAAVVAVYGVKVVKDIEPYDIEVAVIVWDNLPPGSTKTSTEVLGAKCRLRNQDNMDIYCWWRLNPDTPLPEGVTLKAYFWPTAGGAYEWVSGPSASTSVAIPSGTVHYEAVEWRLTVAPGTLPTTFSFIIDVIASDSLSG